MSDFTVTFTGVTKPKELTQEIRKLLKKYSKKAVVYEGFKKPKDLE